MTMENLFYVDNQISVLARVDLYCNVTSIGFTVFLTMRQLSLYSSLFMEVFGLLFSIF